MTPGVRSQRRVFWTALSSIVTQAVPKVFRVAHRPGRLSRGGKICLLVATNHGWIKGALI
jgi:hypothetical protein